MRLRKSWLATAVAALTLVLAGCTSSGTTSTNTSGTTSTNTSTNTSSSQPQVGGELKIATVAEPTSLDPILAFDSDSYRVNSQIFETLVTLNAGTTSDVVAGLAKSWAPSDGGKTWTFTLGSGVTFQDGTTFNAQAVKYNFDRWQNLPTALQGRAEAYGTVFGGFGRSSIVTSVDAPDSTTVKISLSAARPSLPIQLTLPVFSIASPTALQRYDANSTSGSLSTFANEHPVGTGPFELSAWNHGKNVILKRNPTYWGDKPYLATVVMTPIADSTARLNAVEAGDVNGADQISPRDIDSVKADNSLQVENRASCNSGYVAFKSTQAPFDNPLVREAVSYAINKEAIIKRFYGSTGTAAALLMPSTIPYFDASLKVRDYSPSKAKELLAQAGQQHPTVDFWYPTDMTRPWLPNSQGIYQAIASDLEAVGFKITPKSATWTDYLSNSQTSVYKMFLLGWSCDYGAADNFYAGAFGYIDGKPNARYAYASTEFEAALTTAQSAPLDEQKSAWQKVQKIVYDDNPVVPFVYGSSAMAFSKKVHGYVPNPVLVEHLNKVWISQ